VALKVRYLTDPACPWSWSLEPVRRRLGVEFGAELEFSYVMGGLARDVSPDRGVLLELVASWLEAAEATGMPVDPRVWTDAPIRSTYPACMAVKAAGEQSREGEARLLRTLREGLLCFRHKLDTRDALTEEARRAGLSAERFDIDLSSNAIVEAFAADLEEVRRIPDEARRSRQVEEVEGHERVRLPTMVFIASDGCRRAVHGARAYDEYRAAAEAVGAKRRPDATPGVLDALRRHGRMATREVEAVCDLPTPRAAAELWRLAAEWRVRPLRVLTGYLWEVT